MNLPAGFWDKVNRRGKCWVWTGALRNGYGHVRIKRVSFYAHRIVLQWYTGKRGRGLEASHGPCHKRTCVYPLHLSWKTHIQNLADMVRDGTTNRGRSDLTPSNVRAIRRDPRLYRVIGVDYGIALTTVSGIKNGHNWAWLE